VSRQLAHLVALAVVALALGFALGRCAAPRPAVHVDEHTQVHATEHVAAAAAAEVRTEIRTVAGPVRWHTRIVHVGGDVEERTVEAGPTTTVAAAAAATVRNIERRSETVRDLERHVDVRTMVPDWQLAALAGVALDGAPAYGAAVSRRIFGPVHVGAWALVHPAAVGVSLGVAW
jgi:hypothetical protein